VKELTICIPTFNREAFLRWTVDRTVQDFPDSKLIISDDGSTDGTALVEWPGRYIRHSQNIGPFPNMRSALLAAHTKYCVFLGDDDYLLPAEVQKGIDFLEAHPEVAIYYAPCQLYDEVNQKPAWDAFYVAEDETFTSANTLWNFIIGKHVWPEHAIYRRDGLEAILQPRTSAYWCFADLANAALRGPVHFAKTPYYRNITSHPVGGRSKLGDRQCLTEFDSYTAGLQVLAYDIFHKHFDQPLKESINGMIRQFIWSRFEVASRILTAQNRLSDAAVLKKRMEITGY
jgi:glycosyltransferase involved in cell wall biosynthesis